jgi:hypothetical protein
MASIAFETKQAGERPAVPGDAEAYLVAGVCPAAV